MSVTPTPKQSDDNLPAPTDWDSDYDTGRVTAWWRIDDNPEWVVLLAFASFAGVVELVEQTALYVGAATDKQVADQVTARARGTTDPGPNPPSRPLTARQSRDIASGRYKRAALTAMQRGKKDDPGVPGFIDLLTRPGWFRDAPPGRAGRRDDFHYAVVAAAFIENGQRYKDTGEALGFAKSTIADKVNEARNRGLLTRPGQGNRDKSVLTKRATDLLASQPKKKEKK